VLSVEGAVARLRRASLPAALAARAAPIEAVPGPTGSAEHGADVAPYRPRPRVVPAPSGVALDRILQLTDAVTPTVPTRELVTLAPAAAAERILLDLREWGYDLPALSPST